MPPQLFSFLPQVYVFLGYRFCYRENCKFMANEVRVDVWHVGRALSKEISIVKEHLFYFLSHCILHLFVNFGTLMWLLTNLEMLNIFYGGWLPIFRVWLGIKIFLCGDNQINIRDRLSVVIFFHHIVQLNPITFHIAFTSILLSSLDNDVFPIRGGGGELHCQMWCRNNGSKHIQIRSVE